MRTLRAIFVLLAMLCVTPAFATEVAEGKDYQILNPAQFPSTGKKIEVLEFFFYGCSHCFHLHPGLSQWEKAKPRDVEIIYVPTVFRAEWEPMANTFYALEMMGMRKQLDDALYQAWHDDILLIDADKIADFVAQHGVDRQKFASMYGSFAVQSKVTHAKQMLLAYHIEGTPTLVVDGKYVVVNKVNAADTIAALNGVIDMARKERAGRR